MIKFSKIVLTIAIFFTSIIGFAQESKSVTEIRKVVVEAINKVEKVLLGDKPNPKPKPPEPNKCPCNGTGYITHGDGHKTVCPVCNGKGSGDKKPTIVQSKPSFIMYTKSWCGPCQQWKRENSQKVKDAGWGYVEIEDDVAINAAGVTSYPTFDVTINGKVYRHKGFLSMEKFHEIVNDANREVRK